MSAWKKQNWRFPKWGTPSSHPLFIGIFHELNPAVADPPWVWKPPFVNQRKTLVVSSYIPPKIYSSNYVRRLCNLFCKPCCHWCVNDSLLLVIDARMMEISSDQQRWWSTAKKKKPCVHHFDSMTGWIKMIHPPLSWQWTIRHLRTDWYVYIYTYKWANYNNSLTWNLRPFWDDSSIKTMIPGFGRSEVVMKFTHIYIIVYTYISHC